MDAQKDEGRYASLFECVLMWLLMFFFTALFFTTDQIALFLFLTIIFGIFYNVSRLVAFFEVEREFMISIAAVCVAWTIYNPQNTWDTVCWFGRFGYCMVLPFIAMFTNVDGHGC